MSDRSRVALLVIDLQIGLFQKSIPIYQTELLIKNIRLLIGRAHTAGVPVFFIQHASKKILREGSPEWRFHPDIQPSKIDRIVPKHHGSAFEETTLQAELLSRSVRKLVITGLATHGCVRAACLDAQNLGYEVILAQDGHSNYHKDASQVIREWNQKLSQGGIQLQFANEINCQELIAVE
jgi:nicotinamidase-related amidase